MKMDDEKVAVTDDDRAAIKGHKGFRRGKSGNPRGRRKGSKNKATLMSMAILNEDAEEITKSIVRKAIDGDETAMRLCLERLVGKAKGRPIELDLGDIQSNNGLLLAHGRIVTAIGNGSITPDEANTLLPVLESFSRCLQLSELDQRLKYLEQTMGISNDD